MEKCFLPFSNRRAQTQECDGGRGAGSQALRGGLVLDRLPAKTYLNPDTMVLLRADDPRLRPPAAARSLHVLDDDHTRVFNDVDLTGHTVYSMDPCMGTLGADGILHGHDREGATGQRVRQLRVLRRW